MWIWTARFQDLQCQHAVSEFTQENRNRFDHRASSIALIMRGKGWIEAARFIRGQKTPCKDAYFTGMPWYTLQVISPNRIDRMIDC